MNTLFTHDVRQTLDQFRRSVDEMFDEMFDNVQGYKSQPTAQNNERVATWPFSLILESAWGEHSLNLRAVIPGVPEKDVRVSVQNNQLIIEGERRLPEGFEKNAFVQMAYGKFYTAVTLPAVLDVDQIQCRLHDGVLDIGLPLSEASKPRQIRINTSAEPKSIGA